MTIYLPHIPLFQLEDLGLVVTDKPNVSVQKLTQDWQEAFCEQINYPQSELPWTFLRQAQFDLGATIQTVCCCDPVLMQLTHRGAYMAGQHQLQINDNDAIRVVAQINERLMGEGEQLLLVDKHSWLFTSEQDLDLQSQSVRNLIGKDMFNHAYGGDDSQFWQQLNTEIQMLIKEMIDYQGLAATSPETMINVHFYDRLKASDNNELPFVTQENLVIFTDNELMKSFCMNSLIRQLSIEGLEEHVGEAVVVAFDSEKECYHKLVSFVSSQSARDNFSKIIINCLDARIDFNNRNSLMGTISSFFNK